MFNTRSWLKVFLSLRKVRIGALLLASIIFLGLEARAYAQATFQGGSIPVTSVSNTDNTARAGDIVFTVVSGTSISGTITITYGGPPLPITCPLSAVTVTGTGALALATINGGSTSVPGRLIINVPAGGVSGNYIRVSGVRLGVAGLGSSPITASISIVGNAILAGGSLLTVINSVIPGIASLSGTPGLINAVTGAVTISPIVGAREGYLNAFRPQESGDTTAVIVRFSLLEAPPAGVTVGFPAEVIVSGRRWQTTDAYGYVLHLPMDITSTNWLPVYYKSIDPTDPTNIETVSIPVTLSVSSSVLPLSPTTISYTASLAPIGPAFDGYDGIILAPIPRFVASEVGPATLFTVMPLSISPIAELLNPDGDTNEYQFVGNLFNYKVTYPAFTPPAYNVYLVVQPILISQDELDALVDGTAFEGAHLVPYDGLGGFGVLFRVTCANSAGTPIPCPAPGGTYEVKTSWEPTGQDIVAPAFLKAPEGTNNWENIFTNYYEDRIDPTGSGRACCRYSDFVFVDGGSAMAGASPPTIRITTPQNGATYAVNQIVAANYVCRGSQVKSCLGPVLSGRRIDTSSPGTKTFEVNATVTSGPTAVQVVTYYVRAFDLHLLYDPNISIKSGWPILIMLELSDANGKNVSSSKIRLKAESIVRAGSGAGGTPQPWGFAKSCKDFLYIPWPAKGWYVFLLDTRGLGAGSYLLQFTVSADSGSTYSAPFKIR